MLLLPLPYPTTLRQCLAPLPKSCSQNWGSEWAGHTAQPVVKPNMGLLPARPGLFLALKVFLDIVEAGQGWQSWAGWKALSWSAKAHTGWKAAGRV